MYKDSQQDREYPAHAAPIGTIVKSKFRKNLWGVIRDARVTHLDMDDREIISYDVRWHPPLTSNFGNDNAPTVMDLLGLDFFSGVEMEYDLIYLLDPKKEYNFATK